MVLEQRPDFPSRRKPLTPLHSHELALKIVHGHDTYHDRDLCHVIPVSKQIGVMAVQREAVINPYAHVSGLMPASWCTSLRNPKYWHHYKYMLDVRTDAVLTGCAPLSLSLPHLFPP